MDRTVEIVPSPPSSSSSESTKRDGQRERKPVGTGDDFKPRPSHWRNACALQIYSSNLIRALHRVHTNRSPSTPTSSRTRQVREAADRVLASASRGRTQWSRSILLSHRRNLKIKSVAKRRPVARRKTTSKRGMEKKDLGVEGKVRVLGKLVPGCRKLPFPSLLEETTDYIAALEMQVKAMAKLAEILSAAGGGSSSIGDR